MDSKNQEVRIEDQDLDKLKGTLLIFVDDLCRHLPVKLLETLVSDAVRQSDCKLGPGPTTGAAVTLTDALVKGNCDWL